MISGLMPGDGSDAEQLRSRVLAARYSEVRMLFFLGKDVFRWIEQCMEWSAGIAELADLHLAPQSFAQLLAKATPLGVREKLLRWGVADYSSLFSRAIGLHVVFRRPPEADECSPEFLNHYHRFADALYRCYLELHPLVTIGPELFQFEIYASGEYSRKLESEWEEG